MTIAIQRPLAVILLALAPVACADSGDDAPTSVFDPRITTVVFEIDAQEGVEPQGASSTMISGPWELLDANVTALFEGSAPELDLPAEGEFGGLEEVPAGDLDVEELLALSDRNRDRDSNGDTAAYHVLFVDRYFEDGGKRQDAVLGVSIGSTRVIAMFAPVIGTGPLARYLEQTTLIHEFGHAVGLVDNGIPMAAPHGDPQHDGHCDERSCVMFWLNEGVSDLRMYVEDYVASGDVILFDDACLADTRAAAQ